jgi:hypothetical protein
LISSACFMVARISLLCIPISMAIFGSDHLHQGQIGFRIVEMFFIAFMATGFMGAVLSFPLRCVSCGKRLCVVMNKTEISPEYLDREKAGTIVERIRKFFVPAELTLGTTHCAHCDEEYLLFRSE